MSPTPSNLFHPATFFLTLFLAPLVHGQVIVAHRGASFDAPENTMAAFNLAWNLGADAIEGDFYLTRDGHIVCMHDARTERTGGKKLKVAEATLADLRKLDVGVWKNEQFRGEGIATLDEVLQPIPPGKIIYIEVKCGPEILPALGKVIETSGLEAGQIRIIAFDKEVIRAAKKALPQYKAYWLTSFKKDKKKRTWTPSYQQVIETAQAIKADGVDVKGELEVVDKAFLTACHDAGLSTHVWTIDDPKTAQTYVDLGVSSITTNRPDVIRAALAKEEGGK